MFQVSGAYCSCLGFRAGGQSNRQLEEGSGCYAALKSGSTAAWGPDIDRQHDHDPRAKHPEPRRAMPSGFRRVLEDIRLP